MKPALHELFTEYAEYHRHPVNILIHKIAVPMIFFNAMAMLDWVVLGALPVLPGWPITAGQVFVAFCAIWYLAMDLKLGTLLALSFLGLLGLGRISPVWVVIAAGLVGWAVQMAGHLVWEKKAPTFTKNAIQALVGPIYFLALVLGAWRAPDSKPTSRPADALRKGGAA